MRWPRRGPRVTLITGTDAGTTTSSAANEDDLKSADASRFAPVPSSLALLTSPHGAPALRSQVRGPLSNGE